MIIIIKINIISTQTRLDNYYNSYNWVDVIITIAQIIIIIRVIVFILAVLILVTISDITIIVLIEKCWKS